MSRVIKGNELELGMVVVRVTTDGDHITDNMIVYRDGPYYHNGLYADEDFKVVQEVNQR